MNIPTSLWSILLKYNFTVSTDTRKDLAGTIFFALRGENFDGNEFILHALKKGARAVVTDNSSYRKNSKKNIFVVKNVQNTLEEVAREYRKIFDIQNIPIVAIGGSNGKTTSKELVRKVLSLQHTVHSTEGSLNNHLGVPLSILSMPRSTDIGIFEIGANHPEEHTHLLEILKPTHVVVTNNGKDHLEGFGSAQGARKANKEIYDWAALHKTEVFVHKRHPDLLADSKKCKKILYPEKNLKVLGDAPLIVSYKNKKYKTHLAGKYNAENIELALAIGRYFGIAEASALKGVSLYISQSHRSEMMKKNGIHFVLDCYNANPTSMMLALESFVASAPNSRGVIIGDMLELGKYSRIEHKKIVKYVLKQKLDCIVFIGSEFKKVLEAEISKIKYEWFPDSTKAHDWFAKQDFKGSTFLLKGSRGIKVEKVIG